MSKFSLDDGVGETWEKLRDDNDGSVDWMLVGYTSKTACAVKACGVGGRTQCLAAIEPGDAIVFGAFRVTAIDERENTTSRRTKFCVFMFTSPNAPVMQRAKAGSHKTDVWRVMAGSHVQFQMDNLEDMSEAEIVKKLRACGGAHQPTGFDFGAGDVGEGAAGETAAKPVAANPADFAKSHAKAPPAAAPPPPPASPATAAPVAAPPAAPPAAPVAAPVAAAAAAAAPAMARAPPQKASAPAVVDEGGDCAILLITGMPSSTVIDGEQKVLRNIFVGKKVPFIEVDGLDVAMQKQRNALFAVSGLRGKYPQVFLRVSGVTTFVGDFEKASSLNDCDDIPADVLAHNPNIETLSTTFAQLMR